MARTQQVRRTRCLIARRLSPNGGGLMKRSTRCLPNEKVPHARENSSQRRNERERKRGTQSLTINSRKVHLHIARSSAKVRRAAKRVKDGEIIAGADLFPRRAQRSPGPASERKPSSSHFPADARRGRTAARKHVDRTKDSIIHAPARRTGIALRVIRLLVAQQAPRSRSPRVLYRDIDPGEREKRPPFRARRAS